MANISDLSGDEREQRIAELKKKMQAAAEKRAQEQAAGAKSADKDTLDEAAEPAVAAEVEASAVTATTTPDADDDEAEVVEAAAVSDAPATPTSDASDSDGAGAEAVAAAASVDEPAASAADESDSDSENVEAADAVTSAESSADAVPDLAALAAAATGVPAKPPKTEAQKLQSEMNRREFLVYSWGAALGLVLLGTGVATFQFMYPRFKAGEFGGAFLMGPNSAVPSTEAAPEAVPDGKFWWVNVDVIGPQALYMVCTHLGCLYKWVDERDRFECPCHGSKFTRDGLYIEGPAPRSLDRFVTELVDDIWVVDTGARIPGAPASESPAAGTG